jgi:hypothetical protein
MFRYCKVSDPREHNTATKTITVSNYRYYWVKLFTNYESIVSGHPFLFTERPELDGKIVLGRDVGGKILQVEPTLRHRLPLSILQYIFVKVHQ